MAPSTLPTSDFVERQFLDYLSSVPAYKAGQILGLQGPNMDFATFASSMVAGIPPQYFNQPPPVVNGTRFVVHDGNLTLFTTPVSTPKVNWPSENGPSPAKSLPAAPPVIRPATRRRSLNSFMIFRSFIAPLFHGIMQKQKSVAIANLWASEPLKAQWCVMAKAYTMLRDNFDLQEMSLSEFTATVAPMFGIPSAMQYITMLGWEISEFDLPDGQKSFDVTKTWDSDLSSLNLQPVSVENILTHYRDVFEFVLKDGSAWPLPQQGYSALALNTQHQTANSQSLPDPFGWLFNHLGERQDGPVEEFSLDDMYDEPDPAMDPIQDLLYVPSPEGLSLGSQIDEIQLANELEQLFPEIGLFQT
ncbi:Mating-type protein MAT alpha 1 [Penicillium cinerascens]|uniref:Mating-type protein MAT alpha 1 n=1 Tax=Penicillium cinerascens TaxID=70096 RepID=A0A9W9MDE2_9EURO|nr:Mating-type protein MAT alpha 1 [Penicillium cinerascens]KAJ5198325.1 Mating-type protein MAT alpha 1 [Penicillium cinerascens]